MKWNLFSFFSISSPLHEAAQNSDYKALLGELKSLYARGELKEKIDAFYQYGQLKLTPICVVLNNQEIKNVLTSVRHLLSFGANPSLNTKFVDGDISNAPIHEAARKCNLEAIAMLILAGADIYQAGSRGIQIKTLLQRSCGYSEKEFSFLINLSPVKV